MTTSDDDSAEVARVNEIVDDAAGLGGSGAAAMTRFLTELRDLGSGPAPEPSPELAAVLAGATPIGIGSGSGRRRGRRRVVIGVAAAVLIGGTSGAAATGRLPQPAQRMVSNVVDTLTPFSVPPGRRLPIVPLPGVPVGSATPRQEPTSPVRHGPTPTGEPETGAEQDAPGGDDSSTPPSTILPGETGASDAAGVGSTRAAAGDDDGGPAAGPAPGGADDSAGTAPAPPRSPAPSRPEGAGGDD